jgi:hypothetical protein
MPWVFIHFRERRVELGRMKYPYVRSRCIADEASEPSRTVEEARCRALEDAREADGRAFQAGCPPRLSPQRDL